MNCLYLKKEEMMKEKIIIICKDILVIGGLLMGMVLTIGVMIFMVRMLSVGSRAF